MMPTYEFEDCETGVRVEKLLPASAAPRLDSIVWIDGRRCRRVVSVPARPTPVWRSYISHRLPRFCPGAEHTADGKPIVQTQAQERDLCSRLGFERE